MGLTMCDLRNISRLRRWPGVLFHHRITSHESRSHPVRGLTQPSDEACDGGQRNGVRVRTLVPIMAKLNDFAAAYRHPEWQKKRLEIMERDGFECTDCGDTEATLNVHHSYYERNLKPWEYPSESLHTLCESCHEKAQDISTKLKRQLGKIALADMEVLLGYARGLEMLEFPSTTVDVESHSVAIGIAEAWRLNGGDMIAAVKHGTIDGYTLHEISRGNHR